MHVNSFEGELTLQEGKRVAIVVSRFNEVVTGGLLNGAIKELKKAGAQDDQIDVYKVPGAVEIPLIAQKCAKSERYDMIVTLGCVIRGETSHYDYVCKIVTDGVLKVNLNYEIPVLFGVLTTENQQQAEARSGDNENNKGGESVKAGLEMLQILKSF